MASITIPFLLSLLSTLVKSQSFEPTDIKAIQTGIEQVTLSWTPSRFPPANGYRVYIGMTRPSFVTGTALDTNARSHIVTLRPGVHYIWLIVNHNPLVGSPILGPVIAYVRDFTTPLYLRFTQLTAMSVTIHWNEPRFTRDTDTTWIILDRLVNDERQFCPLFEHNVRRRVTGAMAPRVTITNLQENSIYVVTMIYLIHYGLRKTLTDNGMFTTLSGAPTAVPVNITYSVSFRSCNISWGEVPCIERNGPTINYVYQLRVMGGNVVPDDQVQVVGMNFRATGLTPNTNYIFEFRAVNNNGFGPTARIEIMTLDERLSPMNLTARQLDAFTALFSWTILIPPNQGYLITFGSMRPQNFDVGILILSDVNTTRLNLRPGFHSIWLVAFQPDDNHIVVGPVNLNLRDFLTPLNLMLSPLNATYISISWTQPEYSLPTDVYWVELRRLVGDERQLCPMVEDYKFIRAPGISNVEFADLHEFSIYQINITTSIAKSEMNVTLTDDTAEFTTLIVGPTAPPPNILYSFSSRSINGSWTEIECLERNGPITDYTVELREVGGDLIPGVVVVRTFTASGLIPYTNYTLRVAGKNNDYTGTFSDIIRFTTLEDTPGRVSGLVSAPRFTFIILTWRPPEEPNGVIISYEVTYTVNGSNTFRVNTSNSTFTIPSLTPRTSVSPLAVTAYTKIGRGEPMFINESTLDVPSVVLNVEVIALSYSSVNVSWNRIDNPLIISYTIYYTLNKTEEETDLVTVPSSLNSVVIGNLTVVTEYLFQVAATAEIDGDIRMGELSTIIVPLPFVPPTEMPILTSVLGGILGISILIMIAMIFGFWVKSKFFTNVTTFANVMELDELDEDSVASSEEDLVHAVSLPSPSDNSDTSSRTSVQIVYF